MKKLHFLLLFTLLTCELYAQTDRNHKYSLEQICEDFDSYITALKITHPDLYAYISKDDFNKKVEQARLQLKDSMNLFEFGKVLLSLNHCLDRYSGIDLGQIKSFYTRVEKREKEHRQGYGLLYPDSIIDNFIYIRNKKALTINGVSCNQIMKQCQQYINQGDEANLQECRLKYEFPTISYYFLNLKPPYIITYQDNSQETINGFDADPYSQFKGYCHNNPLHWEIYPEESIAYLEFNTCALDKLGYPDKLNATLDSLFQEVKDNKCNNLFIDITQNSDGTGGEVPSTLLSRFKNDSLTMKMIVSQQSLNSKEQPVILYTRPAVTSGYEGNVFLITGPWTYATVKFLCVAMKVSSRAVFVGETPGRASKEYTNILQYEMPNTQLNFKCVSKGYSWDVDLTPDIPWSINCSYEPFTLEDLKKMIELNRNKKK